MANSPEEAIETGTVNFLLTLPGIVAAKAVPIAEQFRQGSTEDSFVAEQPDGYPGCTVSLNDDETEVSEVNQRHGAASAIYRAPLYIAMFVVTDGTTANNVRWLAWQYRLLLEQNLMLFAPSYPGTTMWPLQPDTVTPILLDANTYGQLMKFWAKYQLWVKSD